MKIVSIRFKPSTICYLISVILIGCQNPKSNCSDVYFKNGIAIDKINNKPFSGTWICNFENGELESKMNYRRGYPAGSFIQMAKNGEVLYKGNNEVIIPFNEFLKSKGIKFHHINIMKNGEGDLNESEFPYFDIVIYQMSGDNNLVKDIKEYFFKNKHYLPLFEFRFTIEEIDGAGKSKILFSEWYSNSNYFK